MSNKQETISEVVAEMRNEGHTGDASCLEWVGAKIAATPIASRPRRSANAKPERKRRKSAARLAR